MEGGALEAEALLAGAQRAEVFCWTFSFSFSFSYDGSGAPFRETRHGPRVGHEEFRRKRRKGGRRGVRVAFVAVEGEDTVARDDDEDDRTALRPRPSANGETWPRRRVSSRTRGRALVAIGSRDPLPPKSDRADQVCVASKYLSDATPPRAARAAGDGAAPGAAQSRARAASRSTPRSLDRRSTGTSRGPRGGWHSGKENRSGEICRRSSRDRSRRGRRTGGLGGDVGAESHLDTAGGLAADGHVEEAHGVGHGVLSGCSRERAQGRVTVTCAAKTLYYDCPFCVRVFVCVAQNSYGRSVITELLVVRSLTCLTSSKRSHKKPE